ncbi:BON domain-containing protein [Nitrosomonas communis]|uniref:Osmotically-inducible protein Y n=1 Tax=Nitrosomonas communis TaxID=44574 RepID=A0A1H2Q0X5_9PROT|nr:BON domain-containing protein [Nitrosomonas communis]SDW00314.1 BON domain-containing protein [Nitrosomonas communis]
MKQLNNRFFAFLLIVLMAFFLGGTSALAEEETAGEYLDNSVITAKVKKAIFDEPGLKSSEIKVETFKGGVLLSGFVNSQNDMDRAVEVAREVEGVKSVKNSMEVKGQ